jgi:transcriptional regulator with XRE-family HTH domain
MTANLPIHDLVKRLEARFPTASIVLRKPAGAGKTWWLDLALGPTQAEVEWSSTRGFGIAVNSESVYGSQSDEMYSSTKAVYERLAEIIASGGNTEDSSDRFVRSIRQARELTQTQLAKILDIKQASVSKLETRSDFHVSTLRSIIAHLGGDLELRATFPDGSVHIMKYQDDAHLSADNKRSGTAKQLLRERSKGKGK